MEAAIVIALSGQAGRKADQVVVEISDDQTAHGPGLVARCLPDASAGCLERSVQGVDIRHLDEGAQQVFAGGVIDHLPGYVPNGENRLITHDVGVERDLAVDE